LTLGDAALAQPSQDPVAAARLREAGWQLAHVSSLLGETPLVDLFRRFPAPPADQSALFVKAASILVASARTRLEEGEFSEADDLIADSAEWLAGAGTPPDDVLEETSRLSWNLYWYTGDAANWSRVEEFGTRYPAIAAGALWKAHAALRHSLRCETTADEVTAMAQDSPDPDVANINGIAYVLSQSRIETGFLAASFKAGSLVVRDAAPARYFSWAEFQIRQLQIKQILLRADLPHARAASGVSRSSPELVPIIDRRRRGVSCVRPRPVSPSAVVVRRSDRREAHRRRRSAGRLRRRRDCR
jgi:hypothetical protein